ncbi:MAG: type VI secretion system lipoprotein TssJ [Granulosicoccus sp.]
MHFQTGNSPLKVRTLFILISVLTLPGCGILQAVGILDAPPEAQAPPTPPSQVPYTVTLTINTSPNLNPRADNEPSPVRVRLFLTESDKDLMSQPFETIFEFDGSVPASKPSAVIVLSPDETRSVQLNGMMSQDQLVVAAAFHDVYSTIWIANKTIDTNNPGRNTVAISSTSVEIQ